MHSHNMPRVSASDTASAASNVPLQPVSSEVHTSAQPNAAPQGAVTLSLKPHQQ